MGLLGDLRVSIGAEIGSFTSAMDRVERRIQSTEKRFESLGKLGGRLRSVGTSITAGVGVPLAGIGAIAIRTFGEFEKSMNRVRALTQATGEEFQALRDLAIEQGRATIFSATDSARAMGFLAQAGLDTRQVIEALPGALQLAAAGGLDLAAAADIATNVLAGMQLEVSQLSSVNDKLALTASKSNTNVSEMGQALAKVGPIASNSGQSLDDVSAALGALANQGIKGAEAGTAVRRIIGELIGPSTAAKRALADLGITLLDANGQIRPLVDVIGEFERAQARLGDQTQFTARLFEIFGDRGGPSMAALISTGEAAVRKLSGSIQQSDGFAKSFAETANQGVPKAMAEMKAAAETLGITLAEKLAPEITALLGSLKGMADSLGEVDKGTLRTIATIGGLTVGFGAAVTVAGVFVGALRNILVVAPLVTAHLGAIATLLGPAGLIAAGVLALSPIIARMFIGAESAADGFIGKMATLDGSLTDVAKAGKEWVPQQAKLADVEKGTESFNQDLAELSENYKRGAAAAREFFAAQQAGAQPDVPSEVQTAPSGLPKFFDFQKGQLGSLVTAGRSVVDLYGMEAPEAAGEFQSAFSRAMSGARKDVDDLRASSVEFRVAFNDTLRDLERAASDTKALDSLSAKIREWIDLQRQASGMQTPNFALGLQVPASQPGTGQAPVPPGLLGVIPDAAEDRFVESARSVEAFFEKIGAGTAEARAELQAMFDVVNTGTLAGTPLDPQHLQLVRDELADRLGFEDLGASIDPIEAKIKSIAATLKAGAAKSDLLPGEKLQATNVELDRMRKTLEDLELSAEFGLQLDDTELQIRRMRETLATGLLPLSGEQASIRAIDAIRERLAEVTLDDFRDDIAAAQGDTEALDAVWARFQARLESIDPSLVPAGFEKFEDLAGAPVGEGTKQTEELGVALQGLLPVFASLQSATGNLFSGIITGAVTAKEAVMDFGRAMLASLAQIIARLTVAVALAAIVAAFGGNGFGEGGVFTSLSGIGGRAIGGSVGQGDAFVVGERGPELFVPHRSGFIIPNHQLPDGERAEGGPVRGGKSYLVGERGPEMFRTAAAAGISPGPSTPLGTPSAQAFRATPSVGSVDRAPSSVEQVIRVDVRLNDEGLIATLDGLGGLGETPSADDLAAMIEPGLSKGLEKELEKNLGAMRQDLGAVGNRIEAGIAKQITKLPDFTDEIRGISKDSADEIRGERVKLGADREAIASGNARAVGETVATNDASQDVLDTVQVDLGDAVQLMQIASGVVLAAAAIDLIPFLASGGPLAAGQMAVVGERGPELFRPRVGGEVVSNKESRRLLRDSPAGPASAGLSLPPVAQAAGSAFSLVPKRSGQAEPGMRALAQGGIVEKDETVLVGEFGPELFLTRFPTFQGWAPPTYREWLGDESSFMSRNFLRGASDILQLPQQAKKETSPGGAFAHEGRDDRQERIDSAIDFRTEFFKNLVEKHPPVHWTAPASGNLLDLETAAYRFGTFGFQQASTPSDSPAFDLGMTPNEANRKAWELITGVVDAPARALGGPVFPGSPFLVGERGPELFVPDAMGQVMSAARTSSMARSVAPAALGADSGPAPSFGDDPSTAKGGINVAINFGSDQTILTVRDWDEFAREIADRIETVGRDYVIGRG